MGMTEFAEDLMKYIDLTTQWCNCLDKHFNGCEECKLYGFDACPANLYALLRANRGNFLEAAQKIDEANDWTEGRRCLTELVDSLTARVTSLERENEELKNHQAENVVLRNRLTQEVLTNLEMSIALDLNQARGAEND